MHKVFINDKPLFFEDVYSNLDNLSRNYLVLSQSEFSINDVINKFETDSITGIIYLCARPDTAWTDFAGKYVLVEAAGGVVKNSKDEILIIFRKKRWDLPKGKLDYNESPESAAVREVKEECGIKKIVLGKFLLKTFHTYTEKNKFILKKTHWFIMSATENEELVPQIEEDIEEVKWMDKEKIYKKVFPKTYASIEEVLMNYFNGN